MNPFGRTNDFLFIFISGKDNNTRNTSMSSTSSTSTLRSLNTNLSLSSFQNNNTNKYRELLFAPPTFVNRTPHVTKKKDEPIKSSHTY